MARVTEGRGGRDFAEGRSCRHLIGDLPAGTGTVVPVPDGEGGRSWLVTGYRQTRDFLRDRRFSREAAAGATHPRGPATQMSVTDVDPPRHTRLRTLVGGAFSARRSEQLRPYVRRVADELLDDLLDGPAEADLLAAFCAPLTFAAQCEILGVPAERRATVRRLAEERLGRPGAGPSEIYPGELRLHAEIAELVADDERPPTGLIGELVAEHRAGGLSGTELSGLASSMFFDGHALAAAQIANAIVCIVSRPALQRRLAEHPGLVEGAVEESFRYSPAVTLSMARLATTDVEMDGHTIAADERVMAAMPLANRDRDVFAEPDEFDPQRSERHVAFGHGTHHCIGAHLARVEVQEGIRALLRRAPDLHLAVPEGELSWTVSATMRSLTTLPVRWRREASAGGTADVTAA